MSLHKKKVLLVDNTSVLAMRAKLLLELLDCEVELCHFSEWSKESESIKWDMILISQGIPFFLLKHLTESIPNFSYILLAQNIIDFTSQDALINLHDNYPAKEVIFSFYDNEELLLKFESILKGEPDHLKGPHVLFMGKRTTDFNRTARWLKKAGCHVQTLSNVDRLDKARFHSQTIDVAMIDLIESSPIHDLTLFDKVKRSHPYCQCILLSNDLSKEALLAALQVGVRDVLQKPFSFEQLVQSIVRVWQPAELNKSNQLLMSRLQRTLDTLVEKDTLLRILYQHTPDGIIMLDTKGFVVEANEACAFLFSSSLENLVGNNILHRIDQASVCRLVKILHSERGKKQFTCDLHIKSTANKFIPVVGSFTRIDFHGRCIFSGVLKNVTHLKQREEDLTLANEMLEQRVKERTFALEQAKDEAEQASRSKSEFLANMSHELRTPMHSILSFANFGLEKCSEPAEQYMLLQEKLYKYFTRIETSGKRLLTLLNDLLDLSKLEAGRFNFAPVSFNPVTTVEESIYDTQGFAMQKGISIRTVFSEAPSKIEADQEHLGHILRNLLGNAIKFSPENSIIKVVVSINSEKRVDFQVIDSGVGIPVQELASIFDKFSQSSVTNKGAGGTGLGLAICKELVELHQGQIWAENNKKQPGATFHVSLPLNCTTS